MLSPQSPIMDGRCPSLSSLSLPNTPASQANALGLPLRRLHSSPSHTLGLSQVIWCTSSLPLLYSSCFVNLASPTFTPISLTAIVRGLRRQKVAGYLCHTHIFLILGTWWALKCGFPSQLQSKGKVTHFRCLCNV